MDELSAGPERIFHSDWVGQDPVRHPDVARLGLEPHMIPGAHCPHVSRPDQLAELIERVADT